MSIDQTQKISELSATCCEGLAAANLAVPQAAINRIQGGASSDSTALAALQPTDGFSGSGSRQAGGSFEFASNFAANFANLFDAPGSGNISHPGEIAAGTGTQDRASRPGEPAPETGNETSLQDRTSKPGAPRRRRRSSGSRRSRRSSTRARGSSRSSRAQRSRRSQRTQGTRSSRRAGLPSPPLTGNRTADAAIGWNGRNFKAGQTKRCADFVSSVLRQSGTAPRGFQHQNTVAGLAKYGRPIQRDQLRPGDVVMFGNTYRRGQYTHTGIYVGNGQFVHRPTANAPVRIDSLNQGYYRGKYTGARRMQD
ncbi:hypothetical protein DYH09_25915 [bacterium CPR1]|nr:hypothetical protein [bacterium CPR1]